MRPEVSTNRPGKHAGKRANLNPPIQAHEPNGQKGGTCMLCYKNNQTWAMLPEPNRGADA
eukprot:1984212-Prymnesium_polylepis.1